MSHEPIREATVSVCVCVIPSTHQYGMHAHVCVCVCGIPSTHQYRMHAHVDSAYAHQETPADCQTQAKEKWVLQEREGKRRKIERYVVTDVK